MGFVLLILGALVVTAAVMDFRARRRGRRIRVAGGDVRDARRANVADYDKHKPGGLPPDATGPGGWIGGFGS